MKNKLFLRFATAAAALFSVAMSQLYAANSVNTVISSGLFEPYDVAVHSDGSAYLVDGGNNRIIRIPAGAASVSVLAGGTSGTNDGVSEGAQFRTPRGVVVARGGIVVADSANHTLRHITFNGVVTTLAGAAGTFGTNDGPAASARFRFPLGLATDAEGNIYVADSLNNAIRKLDTNNVVTTIAKNAFVQPAAVAVGVNGDLWVADTWRHCIRRVDTNGVVTLIAGSGSANESGTLNATIGTNARFNSPRGLLWISPSSGLLVSDTANHSIRRIYYNTNVNSYSVETFAGVTGSPGLLDGDALEAKFNNPVGIARDALGGGFLVVDKGNNQLRRINTGQVQPPVPDPVIGWVDAVQNPDTGEFFTILRSVIEGVFNNELVIAIPTIAGTETIYTSGPTPANPFEDDIPEPGPGVGSNPPLYRDGERIPEGVPPTLVPVQPDVTIKAIGVAEGRRSSAIIRARFVFKVASPIAIGENAASFVLTNITHLAEMWYTWDGSEPTRGPQAGNTNSLGPVFAGETLSFNLANSNRTFKAKAFRNNFKESGTLTKVFSPSNFVANKISFGFENGEASSEFVGAAGQRFYAPVTLSVLPAQKIFSFQFNAVVTNETGTPVSGTTADFESMLEKKSNPANYHKIGPDGAPYFNIPPAMFVGLSTNGLPVFASLKIPNTSINLLAVGWLERAGFANLYDTAAQDLITFSQAHDTVFSSGNGKVILGGYSFKIPFDASTGSTYKIELGRASATADGVSRDVYIQVPTNGSLAAGPINGTKRVTVGSRRYIVGDCSPFRWFNAGDFGNTNLLNNDVLQVFQSAIYQINMPPADSDFFDSMDSSDGAVGLYDGDINSVLYGDGLLQVDDIFVTFRRSLDPSLKWYARFWENGFRQAVEVPNWAPQADQKSKGGAMPKVVPTGTPSVVISADDIVGAPGSTVAVPIRAHITGGLPIRVMALGVTVQPLEGSPALTQPVSLSGASGLGSPAISGVLLSNKVGAAWLNAAVTGVSGDAVIATLMVTIPASATPNSSYRVHLNHVSASENGLKLFKKYVTDGVASTTSRAGSSWNDAVPDVWRLRYFGAISNALAHASADPDGDGVNNLNEFRAGTNPFLAESVLMLRSAPSGPSSIKLFFPSGAGRTYVIDAASQAAGPWSPLNTNVGDGGVIEYINTVPGLDQRFYRVRTQ